MAKNSILITDETRALLGFVFGMIIIGMAISIFTVNSFDFDNIQRGVRLITSGINPWALETRIPHFYNPPFSVLFLWPMLFVPQKVLLVLSGALLIAFSFYHKAWVSLAWFGTNTILWIFAAGGIDLFVIGAGLLLLQMGDKRYSQWSGLILRVLAYGFLMIKPQGGAFIVGLYFLLRRDWKGLLISAVIYGVLFLPLYPDWLRVLLTDPPLAQTEAAHTFHGKFGLSFAILVAVLVLLSRRWTYWQLGGALAGILSPYGMPGVPIFLTLTAARKLSSIPIVLLFSGALATMTWVTPPPGADYYTYGHSFMVIYHMSMLGLALVLAISTAKEDGEQDRMTIAAGDWLKYRLGRLMKRKA